MSQTTVVPFPTQRRKQSRRRRRRAARTIRATPRPAVDLISLRRNINEWTAQELLTRRQRRDERLSQVSDQVCRVAFLIVGVAFFAFIAKAAIG
jgi:hypothetical protein